MRFTNARENGSSRFHGRSDTTRAIADLAAADTRDQAHIAEAMLYGAIIGMWSWGGRGP